MGYYQIRLSEESSKIFSIILPWGKYRYKHLPMGVSNSPEIFQDKINQMFYGFEFIQAYTNGLLIVTMGDWSKKL